MFWNKIYSHLKEQLERKDYMPFVCLVKWTPEGRPAAIKRFCEFFPQECKEEEKEGKGVQGLHIWNLMGRDTLIVIVWAKSPVSLQRFCESLTFGTDISMDVCPAIDQVGLTNALIEAKSFLPNIPVSKARARASKTPKAGG